ncbi:NUDIX hydrolase [Halomonas sp. V046]|uniref:NUDIX hydrolase n=1 Tax=Halomonas sp. V046 TaxID=3459611 RepID=UPI004044BF0A
MSQPSGPETAPVILAANASESAPTTVVAHERIQVVDQCNRPCGSAWRSQMRHLRCWHRATYIVVRNGRGELCVQRRTLTKEAFPGGLDLAAGGVVGAGEAVHRAAMRELAEELGILATRLPLALEFIYAEQGHRIFGSVFCVTHDGPLRLQPEEVVEVTWLVPDEALALPEATPDTRLALELLLRRERGGGAR